MFRIPSCSKFLALRALPAIFVVKTTSTNLFEQKHFSESSMLHAHKIETFWNDNNLFRTNLAGETFSLWSVAKKLGCVIACDSSSQVTIKYPNGDVYIGEIESNMKHGSGVMYYANHSMYSGEWKEDKVHGNGVFKSPDETVIIATPFTSKTFSVSSQDSGLLTDIKRAALKQAEKLSINSPYLSVQGGKIGGTTYSGQFENNQKHGEGVVTHSKDGIVLYDGEWRRDQMHGHAKYLRLYTTDGKASGSHYSGDMFFDTASGQGVLTQPDGSVYTGSVLNCTPHGVGTWVLNSGGANQQITTGTFENGMLQGLGKTEFRNGTIFEAEFVNDVRVNGTVRFPCGIIYTGGLNDEGIIGTGVLSRPNGSRHSGEFLKGLPHGEGIAHNSDGKVQTVGTFKNGNLSHGDWHLNENHIFTGHIPNDGKISSGRHTNPKTGVTCDLEVTKGWFKRNNDVTVTLPGGFVFILKPSKYNGTVPYFAGNDVLFGTFNRQSGKFFGSAIVHFANGDIYAGEICRSMMTSGVIMTQRPPEEFQYKGDWSVDANNKNTASGVTIYKVSSLAYVKQHFTLLMPIKDKNGDTYYFTGDWRDGKPHGVGLFTFNKDDTENQPVFRGVWSEAEGGGSEILDNELVLLSGTEVKSESVAEEECE